MIMCKRRSPSYQAWIRNRILPLVQAQVVVVAPLAIFVVDSLPALEAGKLEAASSAPLTAAEEAAIEKLLLEEDTVPQGGRDKSKGKEKGKGDERKSTGKSGKKSKSKERPGLATVTKDNTGNLMQYINCNILLSLSSVMENHICPGLRRGVFIDFKREYYARLLILYVSCTLMEWVQGSPSPVPSYGQSCLLLHYGIEIDLALSY